MYIEIKTNKYPYNFLDLLKDNPLTSFPENIPEETLNQYGVYTVINTEVPAYDPRAHVLRESFPVKDGNIYKRNWSIENLPEDVASINQRQERNRLLQESDWTQTEDSPVDKNVWKTYRQALRDISVQPGFPYNVTWPELPT